MDAGLIVREFEGRNLRFHPHDRTLWLAEKEVGEALEYEYPNRAIYNLMAAHKDEFDKDCMRFLESGERIYSVEGLTLLCMFSEQPKAKPFRKWARKVLTEVMTTGAFTATEAHWIDRLAPSERLRLIEMRVQIGTSMAADPNNPIWHGLMQETYGGLGSVDEYARAHGLPEAVERMRQAKAAMKAEAPKQPRKNHKIKFAPGQIARDPEVRAMVDEHLEAEQLTYREIIAAVGLKYGAHRAPSEGMLVRYNQRRHKEKREKERLGVVRELRPQGS